MKDPEYDLENPNYDNCYVVGPNGFIMRYFISKHDMVIDDVAENDIRGVFGISSLPKALALRNQIMDSPQFLTNFGEHRIYVAFIDSKTMPAEFGYKFRDWTKKYEKEEKIAFAVLDISYIDGSNF